MKYLLAIWWLGISLASAQQLPAFYQHERLFADGQQLFDKGQYVAAHQKFTELLECTGTATQMEQPVQSVLLAQAAYKLALCSFHLLRNDTETAFDAFVQQYPDHLLVPEAHFYVAKLRFLKRYYDLVPQRLDAGIIAGLQPELRPEAGFMLGFSYLQLQDYARADSFLLPLTEVAGPLHDRANYYLGIAYYKQQEYAQAFKSFQAVEQSAEFRSKVPLYIASCLVALRQYPLAEDYARQLKALETPFEQQDLLYMQLGTAFFENGHYAEAIPYLSYYKEQVQDRPDRAAVYRLGFAHYKAGQYTQASTYLKEIAEAEDTLTQAASLYLAFCQLELDKPEEARMSLQRAWRLAQEPHFTQEAHFQYAKASVALNYFDDARTTLLAYLEKYPRSPHATEAQELLGEVFFYTQKFEEAIAFFEKTPLQNQRAKVAYQKACYYYGLEQLNAKDNKAAEQFLQKALATDVEPLFTLNARFWLAETFFFQKKYEPSLEVYKAFLAAPKAQEHVYYPQSLLGQGWCLLRLTRYAEAEKVFARLQKLPELQQTQPLLYTEALLRRGDCLFIQKKYKDANFLYAQAAELNTGRTDYALYQSGICQSRLGDHKAARARLEQVVNRHPNSPIRPEALLALSNEYLRWENKYDKAQEYARQLLNEYPGSAFAPLAHINMALCFVQQQKEPEAISHYKTVVLSFGNAEEPVKTALAELKTLLEAPQMDSLITAYRDKYPGSKPFLDEISFTQARDILLIQSDYAGAIARFNDFLTDYPNSVNAPEALLLRGQAYAASQEPDKALADFEILFARDDLPKDLLLRAWNQAAEIYYAKGKFGRSAELFDMALKAGENDVDKIQARMGLARAKLALQDTATALKLYTEIYHDTHAPAFSKAKSGLEAGKILLQQGKHAQAAEYLAVVGGLRPAGPGAEALYLLAQWLYGQGQYAQARDTIFTLKDRYPSQSHWRAQAFILLADAYWQLNEKPQALETLRSVATHAEDPATRQKAQQQLDQRQKAYDIQQAEDQRKAQEAAEKARKQALDQERKNPVEEVQPNDPRLKKDE
ncbi:MAG: tetratricopeptide repeat protein [Bacteroidetes bacterium]|nr:tetratricopeptide repeat protein [Bacteroidota bacterium]